MSILDKILAHKRKEIAEARQAIPLEEIKAHAYAAPTPRSFSEALRTVDLAVIAEIKKASPSRGILVHDFDHLALAQEYERGGAQALSVLTDRSFFQGENKFIEEIKKVSHLPILRKDFIIDAYQVYETKALGADALLLVVKALDLDALKILYECAHSIGLSVFVETHTKEEIDRANSLQVEIIGINNRDLVTFDVSLERSIELGKYVHPGAIRVSESGIKTSADVIRLREAGFHALLVGEGLVTKANRASALQELIQS